MQLRSPPFERGAFVGNLESTDQILFNINGRADDQSLELTIRDKEDSVFIKPAFEFWKY